MLELNSVSVAFGGRHILENLSVSIQQGEIVGLIGPNGCGKTTLFNTISGLIPLDSGHLSWNGISLDGLDPHERARCGIGRVFQNFGIFRDMTVLENILVALEARDSLLSGLLPWSKKTKGLVVEATRILAEIGLAHLAKEKAASLSGGQMRLLEIMRTVALGSELFLLDEPTAGVSPKMKDDVAKLILVLRDLGKTVVIIEHDINFIQRFCHRIIVLDEGAIVLDDTPDRVRADERLNEIYFGEVA